MPRLKAAVAAALALPLVGCAIANTAPDQKALLYNHGPFESTSFNSCVNPGTREIGGIDDQVFYYPAGQRTYVFDRDEKNRDIAPLTAPTKDNITLTITGQLRFELTSDCKLLKEFHEKIGLKDDWDAILHTYLEQPLNRAVTTATQEFNWIDIFSDPNVKSQWENRVVGLLPEFVKQATGGDYFGKFGLTLQKPELPAALNDALLKVQAAIQETKAQDEENKRISAETDGIRKQVELLGPNGYIVMKAIESGKVQFMPLPDGANVMVAPK